MTVHITFTDRATRTIEKVRTITVYPKPGLVDAQPELVLHFNDYIPQENIPLADIESVSVWH